MFFPESEERGAEAPALVVREIYDIRNYVTRPFDITNDRRGRFFISEGMGSNRIHIFNYYSGGLVFSHTIVKSAGGRTQGLAWGGTYLLVADSSEKKIYHVNTETGDTVGEFPTTEYVSGIEWDGAYIWETYNKPDMEPNLIAIRKVDPVDGKVKSWFHVKEYPLSLALDADAIWVVDRTGNEISIFKCNRNTGQILAKYTDPSESAKNGTGFINGITFDGIHLWAVTTDGKVLMLSERR